MVVELNGLSGKAVVASVEEIERGFVQVSLDAVKTDPVIDEAYRYWISQRHGRKFPARSDVSPRGLKNLLRYTALIAVIDGGADYEYRIVGDACVLAHGYTPQGMRWSALDTHDSVFASQVRKIYDSTVNAGQPYAAQGYIARQLFAPVSWNDLVHCTLLCLPLGARDAAVDYLITFAHYRFDAIAVMKNRPKM